MKLLDIISKSGKYLVKDPKDKGKLVQGKTSHLQIFTLEFSWAP